MDPISAECGYLEREAGRELFHEYDAILGMLVRMITNASDWVIHKST